MGGCSSNANVVTKENGYKQHEKSQSSPGGVSIAGAAGGTQQSQRRVSGTAVTTTSPSSNNKEELYFVTGVGQQSRKKSSVKSGQPGQPQGQARRGSQQHVEDDGLKSASETYEAELAEAPDTVNITALDGVMGGGGDAPDPLMSSTRMTRNSTLSVRSVTEEVKGSLSRTGSLQEMLVSLHEEQTNIRQSYSGVDSEARSSVLGKGNWGTVKIVSRKRDNQKFACKELALSEKMPNSQFEELKSEIESLSRLDHPQIARLYEAFEEPGKKLYLVMELLTGGELYARLVEEAPGGRFPEKRSATLSKRICSALAYLHGQGIVHRDLKLENFVFRDREPDSDRLVLIDFGLAKRFAPRGTSLKLKKSFAGDEPANGTDDEPMVIMSSIVGSSYYIAPEVLDGHYSGPLCDIWSMGVIVYMMLCGKAPFNGKTEAAIMKKAQTGEYMMVGPVWDSVSKDGKDFVMRCLTKDVAKRITAAEALHHPWIVNAVLSSTHYSDGSKKGRSLPMGVIHNMVSFSEFPQFIRIGCQAAAYTFARSDVAELSDLFEILDSDGDGYLSADDLKDSFLESLDGQEPFLENYKDFDPDPAKRVEKMASDVFTSMDTERLGHLRFTYFVSGAVLADKYYRESAVLKEAFSKLDHNRKGFVDCSDLQRLKFSASKAQEIIDDFLAATSEGFSEHRKISSDKQPCIEFKDFLLSMKRSGSKSDLGSRASSMRKKSAKSNRG